MKPDCLTPLSWETLVDYWSSDAVAAETDRIDEHLMGCDTCSATSARVAAICDAVREMIPPFVAADQLVALRARGLRVRENRVVPGERRAVVFTGDIDLLIHRLAGLDLRGAESVGVTVSVEETGDVLLADPRVPFDSDAGEVLVACQRHFAAFPPNITFEVRARAATGAEQVARYVIPHRFEGSE